MPKSLESFPIALCKEDFSHVRRELDKFRQGGVKNIRRYLARHPDEVQRLAKLVRVVDCNRTMLQLFEATQRDRPFYLSTLDRFLVDKSLHSFRHELESVWHGNMECEAATLLQTKNGTLKPVIIKWKVEPGHETTLSSVIVSLVEPKTAPLVNSIVTFRIPPPLAELMRMLIGHHSRKARTQAVTLSDYYRGLLLLDAHLQGKLLSGLDAPGWLTSSYPDYFGGRRKSGVTRKSVRASEQFRRKRKPRKPRKGRPKGRERRQAN